MYYVYILANQSNSTIYTGVTNDLISRVYEHKHNMDAKSFTARYHVHKLVYFEGIEEAVIAIEREKQIKSWNRKRKNTLVETMNPKWMDLYNGIL